MNARYYLPAIGRFLSADTLVPDPANPQSFNRYAYVLNNPLRLTDPTGHCAGDPNVPDNACWSLLYHYEAYYQLRLTGNWLLEELIALSLPLRDMELRLGGLNYFLSAFGGTELVRITGVNPEAAAEVKSPGKISFWDNAFSGALVATRWIVIHEFGHIWDANHLLNTSSLLERKAGFQSCFLEIIRNCEYGPIDEKKSWQPISVYGMTNRREDWADSFAAFMFGGNWEELLINGIHGVHPFNTAPGRIVFAAVQVNYFKIILDFSEKYQQMGLDYWTWTMIAGGSR